MDLCHLKTGKNLARPAHLLSKQKCSNRANIDTASLAISLHFPQVIFGTDDSACYSQIASMFLLYGELLGDWNGVTTASRGRREAWLTLAADGSVTSDERL